jgi:hypothetical protein
MKENGDPSTTGTNGNLNVVVSLNTSNHVLVSETILMEVLAPNCVKDIHTAQKKNSPVLKSPSSINATNGVTLV